MSTFKQRYDAAWEKYWEDPDHSACPDACEMAEAEITTQQARLDAMSEADGLLRKLLWLRHGCGVSALYGDDGEMQCGKCGIDFKRWSAADILQRLQAVNQEAFQRARLTSPGAPQEK